MKRYETALSYDSRPHAIQKKMCASHNAAAQHDRFWRKKRDQIGHPEQVASPNEWRQEAVDDLRAVAEHNSDGRQRPELEIAHAQLGHDDRVERRDHLVLKVVDCVRNVGQPQDQGTLARGRRLDVSRRRTRILGDRNSFRGQWQVLIAWSPASMAQSPVGRKRGNAVPWPVSWNTTSTAWPMRTASGSQSTMLVITRGPSSSSTIAAT